jgi:light-regulated signal transduction histidine kinase (bacteriophytochrome)
MLGAIVRWRSRAASGRAPDGDGAADPASSTARMAHSPTDGESEIAQRDPQTGTQELDGVCASLELLESAGTHDIRASAGVIAGFAKLLQARFGKDLPAGALEHIANMREAATEIAELATAWRSAGQVLRWPLRRVRLDMNQVAAAAIERCRSNGQGAAIALAGALPPGVGDARMMERVWLDVLDHACRFAAGTTVGVRIGAGENDGEVMYVVEAEGAPAAAGTGERAFQPFQRPEESADKARSAPVNPGLFVARQLVQRHGGRLWIESDSPAATRICFALPTPGSMDAGPLSFEG